MTLRLLYVERDTLVARAMARFLEHRGFAVLHVRTADEAVAELEQIRDADLPRPACCLTVHGRDGETGPKVVGACDGMRVPVRILSGAVQFPPLATRWIEKTDLRRLDAFLASLRDEADPARSHA